MDWIPRTVRQRQRKIDEAIKNIELRTGKTANDAVLAKELSISEDELCSWQSQLKVTNVVSLDEFDMSRNGIKHRNIRDFLLEDSWA